MLHIFSSKIISYLRIHNLDFADDESRLKLHKKILSTKPILKSLFTDMNLFTQTQIDKHIQTNLLRALEIGSGVHPFTSEIYEVTTSDLAFNPDLNLVVDAQSLCIKHNSLDLVVGQFVFHHFSDPVGALHELKRVLTKGGLVVLIEPANTLIGRILFPIMHKSEYYDTMADWKNQSRGTMENANQALSYIYFNRDKELFIQKFQDFEILEDSLLIPFGLRYLASGGLNFKQLLPDFMFKTVLKFLDKMFKSLAVHWIIILRKK